MSAVGLRIQKLSGTGGSCSLLKSECEEIYLYISIHRFKQTNKQTINRKCIEYHFLCVTHISIKFPQRKISWDSETNSKEDKDIFFLKNKNQPEQ